MILKLIRRLGARDMEMSVWEIPGNVSHKKEYPDMVRACINLWKEHQLGKNATPEVFLPFPFLVSSCPC